jgi:hypothetical protein
MVESFVRNQASQNILYSEVFLSTARHLDKFPSEVLFSALKESAVNAEKKIRKQNIKKLLSKWRAVFLFIFLSTRNRRYSTSRLRSP